ncbi:hypothetical protein BHECKSOX_477 [Bathymodiolus heckerae thiotrophic gill symbiont]|uniref:hypothetical protein n=1 Tax=Bathymodiolus heckerae thiotrophic gill symbiont TaxID=1052212 RepID=UPI0010B68164|nr:hypothetical protein [Bathymodiolus heckerae thiotrophic gill symbiont]SHN93561.1 hypothetical protein BHECKSOX_477 [Bathymodiolus heckerae thiotrophic gill symbiont]
MDWDIDFNQNRIELTYTSIEAEDGQYRYLYLKSKGFHFHDMHNSLPEIINVTVDDTFAPHGFHPELVTFDADNIYVNLRDSMVLNEDMTGATHDNRPLPDGHNPSSPTGFDNRMILKVEFAAKETIDKPTNDKVIIDDATIDKLFDWRESKYPELFPTHQDSMYVNGYYARFYEGTGFYVGSLKGRLYLYHIHLAIMIDLGELGPLVEEMKAEQMATDEMDNK